MQTGAWRLSIAGIAMATEAPARTVLKTVENCILIYTYFESVWIILKAMGLIDVLMI